MTLINEGTNNNVWQPRTYSFIHEKLNNVNLVTNETHSETHSLIIKEYLIFLERLDKLVKDFTEFVKKDANAKDDVKTKYDKVFTEGKKKKQKKKRGDYKDEEWFIASNQLETILQKCFLNLLVNKVGEPKGFVTDTWGEALVDFPLQILIPYKEKNYSTFLQLQGYTRKENEIKGGPIKFAFAINGNNDGNNANNWVSIYKSDDESIKGLIDDIMKNLSAIIEEMEKLSDDKSIKKLIVDIDDIIEKMENLSYAKSKKKLIDDIIKKMEKLSDDKSKKKLIVDIDDIIKKMEKLSDDESIKKLIDDIDDIIAEMKKLSDDKSKKKLIDQ